MVIPLLQPVNWKRVLLTTGAALVAEPVIKAVALSVLRTGFKLRNAAVESYDKAAADLAAAKTDIAPVAGNLRSDGIAAERVLTELRELRAAINEVKALAVFL